ncbi:cold-shock protein [Pannonibacter carbonis]|uniref:cold-shock protein n=1 Tax=Pannonibacter TaxID=227873 RepID=UPI000D0E8994|nr:cold shock domain-containing protein [Pannonibacter carbonis]
MDHGNVKWFDMHRGIGAIEPQEGDDVLVEIDSLRRSGIETLKEGQLVAFDMAFRAGRGLAEHVKVL